MLVSGQPHRLASPRPLPARPPWWLPCGHELTFFVGFEAHGSPRTARSSPHVRSLPRSSSPLPPHFRRLAEAPVSHITLDVHAQARFVQRCAQRSGPCRLDSAEELCTVCWLRWLGPVRGHLAPGASRRCKQTPEAQSCPSASGSGRTAGRGTGAVQPVSCENALSAHELASAPLALCMQHRVPQCCTTTSDGLPLPVQDCRAAGWLR